MRNANEGVSLSEIVTKATLRKFGSRIQRVDGISNVILSLNESPNDLVMHAG